MLKYIYRRSFYQIFCVFRIIRNKDNLNDWNSLIVISFFESINIFVLMVITRITDGFNPLEGNNMIFVPILYLILCTLNYFILIRNNKSKIIVENFDNKKPTLRLIDGIPLIIYVVASILLFLIFWVQ